MKKFLFIGAGALSLILAPTGMAGAQSGPVTITVVETIGVSDGVAVVPPAQVTVTETIGVSDTPTIVPPAVIGVTELIGVSDSPGVVPPAQVTITEAIGVSDGKTVVPPAVIGVTELIGVSDTLGVVPPAEVTIHEAIGVADSLQAIPPAGATTTETVRVTDAPSVIITFAPAVSVAMRRFLYVRRLWTGVVATFADLDSGDTHAAAIDWGDGTSSSGLVNEGARTVGAAHRYAAPGTYTVTVTVTDNRGGAGTATFQAIVRPHPRLRIPFFS